MFLTTWLEWWEGVSDSLCAFNLRVAIVPRSSVTSARFAGWCQAFSMFSPFGPSKTLISSSSSSSWLFYTELKTLQSPGLSYRHNCKNSKGAYDIMILAGERYEKVPTWSGRHTQLPRNCNAFDEVVCLDNTGRLTQDFVPWGAFVIILSSFKKWTGGKSSTRSQTTYLCLICLKIGQERRRFLSGITPHFVAHFNPWWKTWKVTKWLGKASLIPKVNSNERMIGTFDKTVCRGESEFKRVLKMFRLCCRSCVFKSLKDSRLTARFLWQQTFRYIYHYTELDLSFPFTMIAILSLPASSKCSPASEVRWHLFEMANSEVGRETCCNFHWSNCNVPPESFWSKDVRWFSHVLNCFEMFSWTRFMSTCAICIWCSKIFSRQCLSQTFDESLLAFFIRIHVWIVKILRAATTFTRD